MEIKHTIRLKITQISASVGIAPRLLTGLALWISGGLSAITAIIAVTVHPVFWVIAAGTALATVATSIIRGVLFNQSSTKLITKTKNITDAQVIAVMNSHNGRITAARLSNMTLSSPDVAAAKLRSMAVEGRLTIDTKSSESELIYVSSDRSLPHLDN